MGKFSKRTALVTGGSRGIGAAIVKRLAEEGANVAINYASASSFEKANALKVEVEEQFAIKAIVVKANVGIKEEVDQMIDEVEKVLGSVEILVNNAGIAPFEPFLSLSEKTWDETYQTNVKSIFLTTQRVAPKMIENKYGKIINITSTASVLVTSPVIPHYISSKAAAGHLTKALAIELGKFSINVNAVGPSTVATDMCKEYLENPDILASEIEANPMKRLGTEKQIGDAVVFLASDEAMQINGHLLMVDGGLTVKAAQPEDHMDRGALV
ncbi:3-oxoacyl-ACP reductase [Neobacillus bataviensis LMG 21833]|uniref:3-oxoacyl-ACP reductase n=1 Tax=Neobacillus bataviensis LMG 21833 TaxID=1117379 RepID=K6DAC0_9BACI|nr:glucose 1-dehydrogenase [Neobacillus bataviensis]EKN65274.1 3-oxoacyl-ACP reductase [Neobacillus bataviensis LMG 21833]